MDFEIKNPNAVKEIDERSLSEIYEAMKKSAETMTETLADIADIIGG